MKRQIITFAGTKEELHKQLKIWCAEADKSMNGTIIGLIEKHLKKMQTKSKSDYRLAKEAECLELQGYKEQSNKLNQPYDRGTQTKPQ